MIKVNEVHNRIINLLKEKGPSLPIKLAKEIGLSSLFISAFLSELTSEKRIKMSHLKVGGSPLYFLEGQEEKLEPYYKYLHPKEAETFLLLKKNKILKDNEQDPSIRVALRSIKDFSIEIKKEGEIYWRYFSTPKPEIKKPLFKETEKQINKEEVQKRTISKKHIEEFQNPLIIKSISKKIKEKSEFIKKVINFLNKNNLKIEKEKDYKTKEYNCIIQIKSQLGLINFLTQAKDKKTISETDLKKLLSNSQKIPLPALLIYTGTISKKAKQYLEDYSSILKAIKIINSN